MFLVKLAFWGSVVVLLLPTGQSDAAKDTQIGSLEALSAASATVSDMRQFCVRQPQACDVGAQALTAFGHMAQASAGMVYRYFTSHDAVDDTPTASIPDTRSAELSDAQNTLTAGDRAAPWRGPLPRPAPRAKGPG